MFFRRRQDLVGTSRDVEHSHYRTFRLLLEQDHVGVALTDITLKPGIKDTYGYPDRMEIAYCISGKASVVDLATGAECDIVPGTLWVAEPGSRFTFVAIEPTRLICVFHPALVGDESGLADD